MGNICGKPELGSAEEIKANQTINSMLKHARARLEGEIKLLLLGAGESGKSTIAKQMKILHLNGFTDEERASYKTIIYNNTVGSMRVLVNAAEELKIGISEQNKEAAARIANDLGEHFNGVLTPELARDIKALWSDPGIQTAFTRSSEFQLNDSAAYYFDAIERISKPDYLPTEPDVLRSRTKTTGIIETEFEVQGTNFRMVDVGGQRSERKKWMHCFQEVTAVIFCVALSEYDLKLYEDDTTNRMQESLKLFKEICNTKWFSNTAMILFLNKRDLFADKITKSPLTACFPAYNGPTTYEACSDYIKHQFLSQNENPKKLIYPHLTCATDTSNINHVFNSVKDIVLNITLDEAGMAI
ncbi:G-protein subunit alpha 1 [Cavenderia fasciculata]|uniref:G-protein subunit alpha 1 n=1 Tax=Cavenderia fasciculata TaxID=261658 RepID=F4Q1R8_CACFS|nr:G-protein subunit alpha 1 [Cavenderia fasciculata]EGG18218.1 G-protein subunit alpha 1 [Cavenderia fasciculata]|eukprot:XP_004357041.1 G-protein subunit alpha 1 [Cavenderia fasciculata]